MFTIRIDGARGFRVAHVRFFQAKLIEDLADNVFRRFVVAVNERRRLATLKLRIRFSNPWLLLVGLSVIYARPSRVQNSYTETKSSF
jgi:hypothetical protein